jgi:hypothetical protein
MKILKGLCGRHVELLSAKAGGTPSYSTLQWGEEGSVHVCFTAWQFVLLKITTFYNQETNI